MTLIWLDSSNSFFLCDSIKKHIKVAGIEKFRSQLQEAEAGSNVGILLTGVLANEVRPYMVLTKGE